MAFILLLGLVSLFGDITYEGALSFLGPYLSILGASAALAGNTLMGFLYGFNPSWIAYLVIATEVASLPFILTIIRRRRALERRD